jgi:hypothetical protein
MAIDWFEMVWELRLTQPEYCESVMAFSDNSGNLPESVAHKLLRDHSLLQDWLTEGQQQTGFNGLAILRWLGY